MRRFDQRYRDGRPDPSGRCVGTEHADTAHATRLTDDVAVNIGAGYRATAYADRLGDRVNGATGSIGVQLGGW